VRTPDFGRFRRVLLRNGEPDYVPLGDISVHPLLKKAVIGRPVQTLEDEVAFWSQAGYDHVPLEQGLQLTDVIRKQSMHSIEAHYAVETTEAQTRSWATEGKGVITTRADFEAFRWPDPDALDYSALEKIGALLPPKVKVVAILGKIFTCVWWLMGLEGMRAPYGRPTTSPSPPPSW
jgi:uroporphyrinogen decarboxylase